MYSSIVAVFLAFYVLLLLLLLVSLSSAQVCPKHFQCGIYGDLNFPFSNYSQPNCGFFMANCSNRISPMVTLGREGNKRWYEIKSPLQGNYIRLHDPRLASSINDRLCSTFRSNNYSSQQQNPSEISYTIQSYITLFRCMKDGDISFTNQTNITYFKSFRTYQFCHHFTIFYRNPKYDYNPYNQTPLPSQCETINLPMVPLENITEKDELFDLLTADFDLNWNLTGQCSKCFRKGQCLVGNSSCYKTAGRKSNSGVTLGADVGIPGIGILTFLFICYYYTHMKYSKRKEKQEVEAVIEKFGSSTPTRYSYTDIKKMTNSFKNELGKGGYGVVYKGYLSNGHPVAVKMLNATKGNGEEFVNEVASICRTSHVNVVSLLGFCIDGRNRAVLYEFMPNGSLEKYIRNSPMGFDLEWLYKIAIGVARGLEYLHCGCNTRILHLDIKPHNILLDDDLCPKISDFGLAKLSSNRKESIVSMLEARGTIGYIAPEVFYRCFGVVSYKSDVYSYGMMLLEIVGARNKPTTIEINNSSETYFPDWAYERVTCNEAQNLQADAMEKEELERKMILVALWCIQINPSHRPPMNRVIDMLEGSLEGLVIPPKPILHSPFINESASLEGSLMASGSTFSLENV